MPKLPQIKPKNLIIIFEKLGFIKIRQKGSHLVLFHEERNKQVVVPIHNKELKKGTLGAILRQADVSVQEIL